MNADDALERARNLRCWRSMVTPAPLGGGLSNHNFVVADGGKKFVARIGGDAPMHNVMRFNEHACARAAAEIGVAPAQVYCEADAQVTVFVDGETFDADGVRANLRRIVARLKTLHHDGVHSLRGPVLAFSVFHVVRHYHKLLFDNDCRSAALLPELMAATAHLEDAVGAVDLALCHNDLLAANFIDDGAQVWIIDWEHAGVGAPLFDLANLASNSLFDEALEREMLKVYYAADADADDQLWRRYKALRAASHLREAMWSMTAEIFSQLDADYADYTDKNLADFQAALSEFKS